MTIWVILGNQDIEGCRQFRGLYAVEDATVDLQKAYNEYVLIDTEQPFVDWCREKSIDVMEINDYHELEVA